MARTEMSPDFQEVWRLVLKKGPEKNIEQSPRKRWQLAPQVSVFIYHALVHDVMQNAYEINLIREVWDFRSLATRLLYIVHVNNCVMACMYMDITCSPFLTQAALLYFVVIMVQKM